MDFGSIFALFKTGKSGVDGFSGFLKNLKNSKINKTNERIIRGRLEFIIEKHKPELEGIYYDLFNEAKKEILVLEEGNEKSMMISKIKEIESGEIINNLDKLRDQLQNTKGLQLLWKFYFYDKSVKELEDSLMENLNKFSEIYFREVQNYYSSNEKVDIGLLKNEKKELLGVLNSSIYQFQKLMLNRIESMAGESIRQSISPNSTLTEEKIIKIISNVEKLTKDIGEGKMNKYYDRVLSVFDKILLDMITKIDKA